MNDKDNHQLLLKFIDQLPVKDHNSRQLFVIGMIGLNGSGKSYLARQIADQIGLYVGSNDSIRRFLNEQGFTGDAPVQDTLQFIAEESSKYLYDHQVSHIIDADLIKFHANARRNAEAHGARFYLINVQCPEPVMRERVTTRLTDVNAGRSDNDSRADINEFEKRLALHNELPKPVCDFTVMTNQDLTSQIDTIIATLRQDGVIE